MSGARIDMNSNLKNEIADFTNEVERLLSEIESWVQAENLLSARSSISVSEEALGRYTVSKLELNTQDGKKLADLVPIGTRILGANGRIDLRGPYDNAILVHLNKGGPTVTTTINAGTPEAQTRTIPFYRGIGHAGWYWIDRTSNHQGHAIDKECFLNLLSQVSDYEHLELN